MRTHLCILGLLAAAWTSHAQESQSPSSAVSGSATDTVSYAVVARGGHSRTWERVEYETVPGGRQVPRVHRYEELETGMHYFQDGQWKESQALIESYPGGAVAQHGQHKIIFANNLNTYGAIDLEMADGTRLQSHLLGLAFIDTASGETVMISEVQDSQGQIVAPNQVIYPDALTDVKSSLRLTYSKSGCEQDLILEERPPPPEKFGLNPATTRLVVMTEFVSQKQPVVRVADTGALAGAIPDQQIHFDAMAMGVGKAFTVEADGVAEGEFSVGKEWTVIDGRSLLLEQVNYSEVAPELEKLPAPAQRQASLSPGSIRSVASRQWRLPARKTANAHPREMLMAKLESPPSGFVVDYSLFSGATNFTFRGDTTYYLTGLVYGYGTNTFEGGAVIKLATNATLNITPGPTGSPVINLQAGPYRPVVFTSKDDNSVGETISGSTGNPTGYYGTALIITAPAIAPVISHFRIAHAGQAVTLVAASPTFQHGQIVSCLNGLTTGGGANATLRNVLFANVRTNFNNVFSATFRAENCTFSGSSNLTSIKQVYWHSANFHLTNCLLANIQNLTNYLDPQGGSYAYTVQGAFNGFYNSPAFGNDIVAGNGLNPFQVLGAGAHYLAADSPYRNAGTTNLNTNLLSELRTKTTYPPLGYSNVTISAVKTFSPQAQRDTDVPDLGYHYEPLDYVFGGVMANSNLTFTAGTVAAWFELPGSGGPGYGVRLADTRTATFNGTAIEPCTWARYSTVQEGGNGLWKDKGWLGGITTDGNSSHSGLITATFTRFAGLASDPNHVRDYNALLTMRANHCEFWSAHLAGYALQQYLTNCLLDRVGYVGAQGGGMTGHLGWRNCTMRGGIELGQRWSGSTWPVWIENCAFDATALDMNDTSGGSTNITYCDYNGFLNGATRLVMTGAHDVVVATFNWQTNALGNFYQPTNSSLLNTGSVTADVVGLYHFTTQTNQVKETNSVVDIGYHRVALMTDGLPLDTDGDGLPDYLEDANGSGQFDGAEISNWTNPDTDNDGMPDGWEWNHFGNFGHTAGGDYDGDGLTNLEEYQIGTDPTNPDTDGDGLTDFEEIGMLVDVSNPTLGYLDPRNPDTGNSGTKDGDKDGDDDALSNLAELRDYGSDPMDAHSFTAENDDSEYLFTAKAGASSTLSLAVLSNPSFPGGNMVQFTIWDAWPNARYDLYFRTNITSDPSERWRWRRVFGNVQCDNAGEATFKLPIPDPNQGYFMILDANDTDGDGLSDGYEAWFTYDGRKTVVGDFDSDGDTMEDGWEAAYGLDPTDSASAGPNGAIGNPDNDSFANVFEWSNNRFFTSPTYDPRKRFGVEAPRPVISISTTDSNAIGLEGTATFTITRTVGTGGNLDDDLTVYYSVGGQVAYGTDYSLTPAPQEAPRIFSAVIPADQTSVTVTVSRSTLTLLGLDARKLIVKLTPYGVSPSTQVSNPPDWLYVVNLFKDSVALTLGNVLPGLNGPVYALKVYQTFEYEDSNPPHCREFHQVVVGGEFTMAGSTPVNNIARWNSATKEWEAMGAGVNGPVYAIEAVERMPHDLSPDIYVGGGFTSPALAMAKWNGASSTWSGLGTGLSSQNYLNSGLCRVNAIRKVGNDIWVGGRFKSAGGVVSPNLAKWSISAAQWQGLGGTIINCSGSTDSGYGLDSPLIMVTTIDPAGLSVGVAKNGVSCPLCPFSQVADEAYYSVENNGTVLRGRCRSALAAGVRTVLGNLAGTDQLVAPAWGTSYENLWGNFAGLGQLSVTAWQLLGGGGTALPPLGGSPWWPLASSFPSGWKPIGSVFAMATYLGDVFIGGSFDMITGAYPTDPPQHVADYTFFNNIFRWNSDSSWSKLENVSDQSCIVPGAVGVNGPIYAMDVEYSLCSGEFMGLWVGGNFTTAGGGTAWRVAFWQSVGSGAGYWDVPAAPLITSPANGAVFVPPADVTIVADFPANGCDLAGVEFFAGNTRLGADTTSPYTFTWTGAPVGTHSVKAIATHSDGRIGISDPVSFRVDAPPWVTLTSPASGATFSSPANVTLSATAADTDGTVSKVEFYANGVLVGLVTSAPYSVVWSSVPAGNYSIVAKATDNDGAVTTSTIVSIAVH